MASIEVMFCDLTCDLLCVGKDYSAKPRNAIWMQTIENSYLWLIKGVYEDSRGYGADQSNDVRNA